MFVALLALLKRRIGLLVDGDVHYGAQDVVIAALASRRTTDHANVLDRAVGHQHAILEIHRLPPLRSGNECLAHQGSVVGVHALHDKIARGFCRRVVSENSVRLLGPEGFARCQVPVEAAGAAEPLGLCQMSLAATECLLGLLAGDASLRLAQCALDRRDQPRQALLQDIVGGADLQRFDRQLLAQRT